MNWTLKRFDELTLDELYDSLALRTEVFVVEQNCPYQECDGLDREALHLQGRSDEGGLLAYARILPPGTRFSEDVSMGRIATSPRVRGQGLGRELNAQALAAIAQHYGSVPVRISAQQHLERFYRAFGFEPVTGEAYDEDGIPHLEMLKP